MIDDDDKWEEPPEDNGLTLGPEETLQREIEKSKSLKVDRLRLKDEIDKSTNNKSKAFFHLHSSIKKPLLKENKIILNDLEMLIEFIGFSNIVIADYHLSEGFNKTKSAYKIIVTFDQKLTTTIAI